VLPDYVPSVVLTGQVQIRGTVLMKSVIDAYAAAFNVYQPNVQITFAPGTDDAIPALVAGTADLGVMDRERTDTESDEFFTAFGVAPTDLHVAIDAMAVFVRQDNPLQLSAGLTLAQLDAVFSKTLKRGNAPVTTWGDLGVTDPAWATQAITPYYRPDSEPTYLSTVMLNGQLKDGLADPGPNPTTAVLAGRPGVTIAPAQDANGIQVAPLAYHRILNSGFVPLALVGDNGLSIRPQYTNVFNGSCPLGTILTFNAVKTPAHPLSPAVQEFLRFVLSKQGQDIVRNSGFGRIPVPTILAERGQLGQ
jgi:phosphate transport system substrate-binding protein